MPKPDYSISVRETYLKVVDYWFHVKEGNDLTFLNYVQDRNDANNLPSWVPDWSTPPKYALLVNHELRAAGNASISATFPSWDKISSTSASLLVKGVRLLTIKAVEVPSSTGFAGRHHAEMLNIPPDPYPTTNQSYLDVYPRALNPSDILDLHLPQNTRMVLLGVHQSLFTKENALETSSRQFTQAEFEGNSLTRTSSASKKDIASKRLLFISSEGFMGLVPNGVIAGDEICILFGVYTPFVIRKLERRSFRLIGECYVHGLMPRGGRQWMDLRRQGLRI
jgi:hypothetical protein